MAGELGSRDALEPAVLVEVVHLLDGDLELVHAGPPRLDGELGAVLLGLEATGRGLDPHRQVLAHDRDEPALVGQVARHREDAGVVVTEPETCRQRRGIRVVELDAKGATLVADRHRGVEPARGDPQVVEQPQGRAGEVAELGVVALGLELGDHHHRQHDLVLLEAGDRARVREEHRGVEHVGATRLLPRTCGRFRSRARGHGRSWGCGLQWSRRYDSPRALPGTGGARVGEFCVTAETGVTGVISGTPVLGSCRRVEVRSPQEPKRRCRSPNARRARRKSTLRKSGQ